jgi:hypothetical protein
VFIGNVLDLINVTSNPMLIAGGNAASTINKRFCTDQITTKEPKSLGSNLDFLNRRSIIPLNSTICTPSCFFTHETRESPPKKRPIRGVKRQQLGTFVTFNKTNT